MTRIEAWRWGRMIASPSPFPALSGLKVQVLKWMLYCTMLIHSHTITAVIQDIIRKCKMETYRTTQDHANKFPQISPGDLSIPSLFPETICVFVHRFICKGFSPPYSNWINKDEFIFIFLGRHYKLTLLVFSVLNCYNEIFTILVDPLIYIAK